MQKAPYVFPILGGRKVEHLEKNLEALEISLTEDHIKRIESVLPFDFGFPYNWFVSDSSAGPCFPLQELIPIVSRDLPMVNIASSSRLEENSTDGLRSRLFALLLSSPSLRRRLYLKRCMNLLRYASIYFDCRTSGIDTNDILTIRVSRVA